MTLDIFTKVEEYSKAFIEKETRHMESLVVKASKQISQPTAEDLFNLNNDIKDAVESIKSYVPKTFSVDVEASVRSEFEDKVLEYNHRLQNELDTYEAERRQAIQNKTNLIEDTKRDLTLIRQKYIQGLKVVADKQNYLKSKLSRIEGLMRSYNIPKSTKTVDLSDMTLEEIEGMMDVAINSLRTQIDSSSINLGRVLYIPLILKSSKELTQTSIRITHMMVMALALVFLKPWVMGVVSFFYILTYLANLFNVRLKSQILQSIYYLAKNINLDKFIDTEPEVILAKEAVVNAENYNVEKDLQEIEGAHLIRLEKIKTSDPEEIIQNILEPIRENSPRLQGIFTRTNTEVSNIHKTIIEKISKTKEQFDAFITTMSSKYKEVGQEIVEFKRMERKITKGVLKINGLSIAKAKEELPAKSIMFKKEPLDEAFNYQMREYIKLLLINFFCSCKEGSLNVTFIDSHDLGIGYTEFFNEALKNQVKVVFDEVDRELEEISRRAINNIRDAKGLPYDKFVEESEKIGKISKPYEIIVIISIDNDLYTRPKIRTLMNQSESSGIYIWYLCPEPERTDKGNSPREKAYQELRNEILVCESPYIIGDLRERKAYGRIPEYMSRVEYNEDLAQDFIRFYNECLSSSRADALFYDTFIDSVFDWENKIWTYDTTHGIDLYFGLKDGDPNQPYCVTLGDKNVSLLEGGTTGSGKSVAINTTLITACLMYPPESLEIYMLDFKMVEFAYYQGDLALPHAKVCAGSKSGEYAVSIYKNLEIEMARRQKLFQENSVKDIIGFNTKMNNSGTPEKKLSRILLLFDEVEAMGRSVSKKEKDYIDHTTGVFAAEARAMGIHMWYVSQTIENAFLPEVLNNFRARVALKVTERSAMTLVGDLLPSTFTTKGFAVVNEEIGLVPTSNKILRVPYLPDEDRPKWIKMMRDKLSEGYLDRKSRFYKEDEVHYVNELVSYYTIINQQEKFIEKTLVMLGRKTIMEKTPHPLTVLLAKAGDQHFGVLSAKVEEMSRFINTFVIAGRERNCTVLLCSSDAELEPYLQPGSLQDGVKKRFSNWEELSDSLENLKAKLLEAINPKRIYVILGAVDSMEGLTTNGRRNAIEMLCNNMKEYGELGVHFIMIMRNLEDELKDMYMKCGIKLAAASNSKDYERVTDKSMDNLPAGHFIYSQEKIIERLKLYDFPVSIEKRETLIEW